MFTYQIAPGSADVSVTLRVIDATDGTPETAVDHATSGIDLKYRRTGSAAVDITEAALAALTTAHTDGGVEQIGAGYIRVDIPDAAVAAGAAECLVYGNITGMVVIGCVIQLDGTSLVNKIYSDTTIIYSDTTIATSKAVQIYSDTSIIYSDTTIATSKATQIYSDTAVVANVYSDTTIIASKAVQVYSDTSIIYSDTTIATSKATQIYSDTAITSSKAVQIYSDTTIIYSDTTRIHSDTTLLTAPADGTAGAYPELGIIDQGTAQSATATTLVLRSAAAFADDTLIGCTLAAFGSTQGYWQERLITDNTLSNDTATVETWTVTPSGTITYKIFATAPGSAAAGSLTAAQDSKLTRVNSKATQVYSDTTIIYSDTTMIQSKATQVYSDTTAIHTQTTTASSKAVQIYSDTTRVHSDTTQIQSDAVHIESDVARCESKAVQIYSDSTAIHSDTTAVHSDTTAVHSDTTAIQTKTDSLTFTQAGHVDANIQRINDVAVVGDGSGTPFAV